MSLSVCTCTHVRTSTFFGFFVHVCCCAKFFFPDGPLFCLLVHIKRVFLRSVHKKMTTGLHVYMSTCSTGAYFHPKICTRVTCRHVHT